VGLMEQGAAWLASQHAGNDSRAVTYSRGTASVSLLACPGRTTFEVDTAFGNENVQSRDFLILASSLVLSGVTVLPESGDKIVEVDQGVTYTYEVSAPGKQPPYSIDTYRQELRIHTKQTARA